MNEFRKTAGREVNAQNPLGFLYTDVNEQSHEETRKAIQLTIGYNS